MNPAPEPLKHATPDQREAYARWADRIAGNKRGRIAEHLRQAARTARGAGQDSFYANVPGARRTA